MAHLIAPSVLSADFGNLQRDAEMLNSSNADWFHVDVMDGVFVPNISFGFPVMKTLQKVATKPLDVHLMIVNPDAYLEEFARLGAAVITVHWEACAHLQRTLSKIRSLGVKAGVALNPHTPVECIRDIATDLDLLLIMSVNPGFGGQKFIPQALDKVKRAKNILREAGSSALIEVDGGVNDQNAVSLIQAGADVLVAGSFVFDSASPRETITKLKGISV